MLARMAVGKVHLITPHRCACVRFPAQHSVVWDIAPQQTVVLRHPHWALAPNGTCVQLPQARRAIGDG